MISIVIPIWNQHELTAECIAIVRETTQDYELILVDNGSDPPYPKPYMGFVDVTLIRNEKNLGFPAAVNQGIEASKGDVIVLLNNDVFVTPGWAERLLGHLSHYSIVGPMTNYAAGRQKTVLPVYEDKETLFKVATAHSERMEGMVTDVNWIVGFCFMFKKSVYDEIGKFDESIWPACGEEIDFCFRAREKGHSVGIARDVYVHHEGSITFKDLESCGGKSYKDINRDSDAHLKKKWGDDFWLRQLIVGKGFNGKGRRINLGCGRYPLSGFVNIDQDPDVNPDLVCDILDLPYEKGTIDEIYAGHVLEHFDYNAGMEALRYWYSLLRPGGKISVCVPDYDVLVKDYMEDPTPAKLREMNDLYIYSYKQKSPHRYAYSGNLLKETMEKVGFVGLHKMDVAHKYFPQPVYWQAGYSGEKP